jgi:hypothetical protein
MKKNSSRKISAKTWFGVHRDIAKPEKTHPPASTLFSLPPAVPNSMLEGSSISSKKRRLGKNSVGEKKPNKNKTKDFFQKAIKKSAASQRRKIKDDNLSKTIKKAVVIKRSVASGIVDDLLRGVSLRLKDICNIINIREEVSKKISHMYNDCIIQETSTRNLSKKQRKVFTLLRDNMENLVVGKYEVLNNVEAYVKQYIASELSKYFDRARELFKQEDFEKNESMCYSDVDQIKEIDIEGSDNIDVR